MITLIQRLGSETQLKDDFIDALIEKIKENPGSCTDVWLASKYGFPSIEEHKKTAEKLSKVAEKFRKIGVGVSLQISNTIGHGEYMRSCDCSGLVFENSPATRFTGPDGTKANYCFCPNGDYFRKYTTEEIKIYVSAIKPDCVWFDDDLRWTNHAPVDFGCFCDDCIKRFNAENNFNYSREELVRAVNDDLAVRVLFIGFLRRSQKEIAYLFSKAVNSACGDSAVGEQYCAYGGLTGYGYEHMFSAMRDATGKAPRTRPGGGAYDDYDVNAFLEKACLINYQNHMLPSFVEEKCPEIENLPDVKFGKTIAGTCLETTLYLASGCTSASYAMLMNDYEPMEWHGEMLAEFARHAPYWEKLAECSKQTTQAGIVLALPEKAYLAKTEEDFGWNYEPWSSGTELTLCGLSPAYSHDTESAYFLHNDCARLMTNEELENFMRKPVITDAETIEILLQRGFEPGIEVHRVGAFGINCVYEDHTVNRGFEGRKWRLPWATQNAYSLIGSDCETIMRYAQTGNEKVPGVGEAAAVIFTTPFGGKWAVFGDGLWSKIMSGERRSEILNTAEYINPGRLSAVLETHAKAIVLPRENKERKLVSVTVINATVGKAKNLKLRVRNTAGTEFSYMSQYNGSGIAVSEDNGDGSITVTLPETDAWSAVTVFIK